MTAFDPTRPFATGHTDGSIAPMSSHSPSRYRPSRPLPHFQQGRAGAIPYDASYILSGKRMMNPSRFGIRTFGSVLASIASFSPMSLFDAKM